MLYQFKVYTAFLLYSCILLNFFVCLFFPLAPCFYILFPMPYGDSALVNCATPVPANVVLTFAMCCCSPFTSALSSSPALCYWKLGVKFTYNVNYPKRQCINFVFHPQLFSQAELCIDTCFCPYHFKGSSFLSFYCFSSNLGLMGG